MYRYDEIDTTLVAERVAQFRDQTRRFLEGKLPEDEFRPLRLPQRVVYPEACADAAHRDSLRAAVDAAAAHAGAPGPQIRSQLRAFHHAPEPAVQLGRNWKTCPTCWPTSPRWRCMPSRPAATASAMSPQIISLASRRTSWRIRGRTARSSASGPHCIREFTYLPRKFKIAVTGSPADRAASEVHDIGLHMRHGPDGEVGLRSAGRRRAGPHAHHRQDHPRVPAARTPAVVPGSHPARVQPGRPPRQHLQGAHQDPGGRPRASMRSARKWKRSGNTSAIPR